jgi:hypothetical protein
MKFNRSSGHKNIWLNDWDCDSRTAVERKWKNSNVIPWIAKYTGKPKVLSTGEKFLIHQKADKNCVLIKKCIVNKSIFQNTILFLPVRSYKSDFYDFFYVATHKSRLSMEKKVKIEWKMCNIRRETREKKKIDENFISNFPSDFISTKFYCDTKKRKEKHERFVFFKKPKQ